MKPAKLCVGVRVWRGATRVERRSRLRYMALSHMAAAETDGCLRLEFLIVPPTSEQKRKLFGLQPLRQTIIAASKACFNEAR